MTADAWKALLAVGFAPEEGIAMQDVTMLCFTAVFFGVAFLYVKACERLR